MEGSDIREGRESEKGTGEEGRGRREERDVGKGERGGEENKGQRGGCIGEG